MSSDTRPDHARLRAACALAARNVAPLHPTRSFVAVNPLGAAEGIPFDDAVARHGARATLSEQAYRALHAAGTIGDDHLRAAARKRGGGAADLDAVVDDLLHGPTDDDDTGTAPGPHPATALTADWCLAWVGSPHASWDMPYRTEGLWEAFRRLGRHDPRLGRRARRRLAGRPTGAEAALQAALDDLGIGPDGELDEMADRLRRLPGWTGHARWAEGRGTGPAVVDVLAVHLTLEVLLGPPPRRTDAPPPRPDSRTEQRLTWRDAHEEAYRSALVGRLERVTPGTTGAPDAQVVWCIDVRSEPMRRALEGVGRYETLGFAGFFAVPLLVRPAPGERARAQCPVILEPRVESAEPTVPAPGAWADDAVAALHGPKDSPVGAFAFAEAAGWVAGPLAALRTFAPGTAVDRPVAPRDAAPLVLADGNDTAARAAMVGTALRMMGLVERFAPLVVLCGHGAESVNNPFESGLACGACGGNPGGDNARALAQMANDPQVRARVADDGIVIADTTWFVAAEHDTVSDRVTILDRNLIPASHTSALDRLEADLARAAATNRARRAGRLPGAPDGPGLLRRGRDWAEAFPEWGLAGNAAMVVAPRERTRGLDLDGRVFLHSYRHEVDPDGRLLETILTGPLVVAQWINCQYLFSTTDPDTFGAGSKAVHNPVGDVGVLAGPGGDLRVGLARQSVRAGADVVHEPLRLLALVEADPAVVGEIVARNPSLRNLVDNEWITLAARPGPGAPWQLHHPGGWVARPATTTKEAGLCTATV